MHDHEGKLVLEGYPEVGGLTLDLLGSDDHVPQRQRWSLRFHGGPSRGELFEREGEDIGRPLAAHEWALYSAISSAVTRRMLNSADSGYPRRRARRAIDPISAVSTSTASCSSATKTGTLVLRADGGAKLPARKLGYGMRGGSGRPGHRQTPASRW